MTMGQITKFRMGQILRELDLAKEFMGRAAAVSSSTAWIEAADKAISRVKEKLLDAALTDVAIEPMERTDVEV